MTEGCVPSRTRRWEAINHLYLNLNANYWGYYFTNIEHPWYKPSWGIGFDGKYILKEKFIFNLNANIAFGRWAMSPVTAVDSLGNTYIRTYEAINDLQKDSQGKRLMKPILNFGLGFEYLITKQLTAFFEVNNVGCQYASKNYISKYGKNEDKAKQADATARLGDCYFMQQDLTNAIKYYSQCENLGEANADYAIYQLAKCYGYQKNNSKK